MRAKKSLGQHFLTSHNVAGVIVDSANVDKKDIVLEIGPGKGFLTELLLKKSGRVIAVEKDARMIDFLKSIFKNEILNSKLKIIHGDILSLDLSQCKLTDKRFKLIANIPYYISGEILRLFLSGKVQPSVIVVLLQKEVAERIVARDGKESILSMSVKIYGTPKIIQKVPARYFTPKPKVDSSILSIENISKKVFVGEVEESNFFTVLKAGFSQKRKMIRNTLSQKFNIETVNKALKTCTISDSVRAEKLSISDWLCLSKNIFPN